MGDSLASALPTNVTLGEEMESSLDSPKRSATLSSHSLQNIAKAVIPLLSVSKVGALEAQVRRLSISMWCPYKLVHVDATYRTTNIKVLFLLNAVISYYCVVIATATFVEVWLVVLCMLRIK